MNPFDFVKTASEGSWMPVLIFLVWLAISLFTGVQNKKKQQRRRQLELERRETERQVGTSDAREKKPDPMEEVRRQLETVFSEERRTYEETASMEDTENPLDGTDAEPHSYDAEPHSYDAEPHSYEAEPHSYEAEPHSYEAEPLPAKKYEAVAPAPEPEVTKKLSEPLSPYHLTPAATGPDENDSQEEVATPAISLGSLDEARKGFLWSEVLAPPKALRE